MFLSDITINDLRDITNSLTGSTLDINDINNYLFIKSIINTLMEKSGVQNENEEEIDNNNKNNQTDSTPNPTQQCKDIDFFITSEGARDLSLKHKNELELNFSSLGRSNK